MEQYVYSQDRDDAQDTSGGSQQSHNYNTYSPFHSSNSNEHYAPSVTYASSFLPSSSSLLQGGSEIRIIESGPERSQRYVQVNSSAQEEKIAALLDSYFIEPNQTQSWSPPPQSSLSSSNIAYDTDLGAELDYQTEHSIKAMENEKLDKEKVKKLKQAEAARLRYHRLTHEQKRELNLKRTLAQKRKRQREKEMEQLEDILRASNDIQEDPDITEQLREKRMRAKWAEAARARYQRMTPEERKLHNNRRRMRQMQNALAAAKATGELTGDPTKDEEAIKKQIKAMNAKKAEAARERYHRMSDEEKRLYNQRRTEAFRRRRLEEEMLLSMPIGRINGEALDRAQQIVVRNAKRAEAARLRYQKMTPEQRRQDQGYNHKRHQPKKKSGDSAASSDAGQNLEIPDPLKPPVIASGECDILTSLERDVLRRTQQAHLTLLRQQQHRSGESSHGHDSLGMSNMDIINASSSNHFSVQPLGGQNYSPQVKLLGQNREHTILTSISAASASTSQLNSQRGSLRVPKNESTLSSMAANDVLEHYAKNEIDEYVTEEVVVEHSPIEVDDPLWEHQDDDDMEVHMPAEDGDIEEDESYSIQ